jgi:hypothetical protein
MGQTRYINLWVPEVHAHVRRIQELTIGGREDSHQAMARLVYWGNLTSLFSIPQHSTNPPVLFIKIMLPGGVWLFILESQQITKIN